MKFFALIAAAAAVTIKKEETAGSMNKVLPDNYIADPLWNFDNKHYADNTVSSLFPDHKPIPESPTIAQLHNWASI